MKEWKAKRKEINGQETRNKQKWKSSLWVSFSVHPLRVMLACTATTRSNTFACILSLEKSSCEILIDFWFGLRACFIVHWLKSILFCWWRQLLVNRLDLKTLLRHHFCQKSSKIMLHPARFKLIDLRTKQVLFFFFIFFIFLSTAQRTGNGQKWITLNSEVYQSEFH